MPSLPKVIASTDLNDDIIDLALTPPRKNIFPEIDEDIIESKNGEKLDINQNVKTTPESEPEDAEVFPDLDYLVETQRDRLDIYDRIAEYKAEMGERFDQFNADIEAYYKKNKQTKRSLLCKMTARDFLQRLVDKAFEDEPTTEVYVAIGGSTLNGCGSSNSDLDLCIVAKNPDKNLEVDQDRTFHCRILLKTYQLFYKHQQCFSYLKFIDSARVPIIDCKLAHPYDDGTLIEINCNNIAGVYNTHLLHYYSRVDVRFPMLALVLKTWGAKENIINPMQGRINSYTMLCMIIHFLQCGTYPPVLPNLVGLYPDFMGGNDPTPTLKFFQDLPKPLPVVPKNEKTPGELLIAFFNYYGEFDYDHMAVSLIDGRLFPRYQLRNPEFHKWLFFLEEVYDRLTIPKNLKDMHVLKDIIARFRKARDHYLILKHAPNFRYLCPDLVKKMSTEEYQKSIHVNRNLM